MNEEKKTGGRKKLPDELKKVQVDLYIEQGIINKKFPGKADIKDKVRKFKLFLEDKIRRNEF